ncbi:MAG: hypothetical protein CVU65_14520 [Deltaproteobacteria bacterium HGW-Deltaproteobacteria-22]|jgi:CRP-like cAMP-binding protein|nr:MAG: hypothetical protein CVU65_14520 [Deltaproteobacteria bacterium HGW-Deltaproteobacteria-22]
MSLNPREALAKGEHFEALHLATWKLGLVPADPGAHLDLLAALSVCCPDKVPMACATGLFDYYLSTANFPASLAVLVFLGRVPDELDDQLTVRFLKTFGPDSPVEHRAPPPVSAAADSDEEPPLSSVDEDELISAAVTAWVKAIGKLGLLPPAQGWKVPLFSAMGDKSLQSILRRGEVTFHSSGDLVMKQGDTDSNLFILVSGLLEVFREEQDIRSRLGFLRSGSFFGEMALVTQSPRSASIAAQEPSVVLRIPWDLLESVLETDPKLADELARYTRMRLLQNLLATSPLFKLLSREAKLAVASAFVPEIFDSGAEVVREGKPSDGLYLVASGEVDVQTGKGKDLLRLTTLAAGEVFGEISLIRESAATATVKVRSDGVVLLSLKREAFQQLAVQYPDLLSHVYSVAIERTQHTVRARSEVSMPAEDLLV